MNQIETYYGIIDSTADALRVFELCRQGRLGRVRRRLHEKERHLIRSGSVFVFDEKESGIRRWTDGRLWSPSRILGNFLIYRELDKKGPSTGVNGTGGSFTEATGSVLTTVTCEEEEEGESYMPKKRMHSVTTAEGSSSSQPALASTASLMLNPSAALGVSDKLAPFGSSGLYGEQFGSYPTTESSMGTAFPVQSSSSSSYNGFKKFSFSKNGLIKKTISVTIDKHIHHLICYYTKRDFDASALLDISEETREAVTKLSNELQMVTIGSDLLYNQSFRKSEPEDIYKRSSLLDDNDPDEHSIYPYRRTTPPVNSSVSKSANAAKQFRGMSSTNGGGPYSSVKMPIDVKGGPASGSYDEYGSVKGPYRYNLQSSNFQLAPSNRAQSTFAQPLLCPASIHPVNGGSSSLYQGILQPANDPNGTGLFSANSTAKPNQQDKSANDGVLSDIENEFGHIAATLSKLTSGNFSTAAIDSPLTATGILPPITGESYTGSLPSLSLMDSKSTDYSMNSAGVSFSISDSQLATAYSEPTSMLAAGQQQKDPHSESAHLTQLLSMPLFPREDVPSAALPQEEDEYIRNGQSTGRMNVLSLAASVEKQRRYEETLRRLLFGTQCN